MNGNIIYAHNLAGRRPEMALVFVVASGMIALGVAYNAPYYFFAPMVLVIPMALWTVIANPQTGLRLTKRMLYFYNRRHKREIALRGIQSATIKFGMDHIPHAVLVLTSGEKVYIPSMCMNRDFGPALASLGVSVSTE